MADTIDFDPAGAKPVESHSDRIDFDTTDVKPAKEVGAAAAGGRGFGEAAGRLAKGLGIIAGGTVGALADKIGSAISGQKDTTIQDAIFRTADEIGKSTKDYYGLKPDETLTTAGKVTHVAGGIAPVLVTGAAAPAVLGGSEAVNTASDVLERGGTNEEANKAAAVAGGANAIAAAIPMSAGKAIANKMGLQNVVTRTAAGAAGGAATQVPTGMAQRAVQNASLPDRPEFQDMQQPVAETTTDLVTGAVFGAVAPGRAGGARRAGPQAEAAQPFEAVRSQLQEVQTDTGVEYQTPNGAMITPELWESASPRVREGWMQPEAAPEATPEAAQEAPAPEKPPRVAELERLREVATDPEVQKEIDARIEQENQVLVDRKRGEEFARLAEQTEDAELKAEFEKKAEKLGYTREEAAPTTEGLEVQELAAEPVEAAPAPERRTDGARRKAIAEMTPEEMRKELLTSPLTDLGNKRAYDEAPKKPVQTNIDADSLKWVNDNLGHDAGDELLRAVGRAIKEETPDGYHISGDEFRVQADTPEQAEAIMQRVAARLEKESLEFTAPDGTVFVKDGIGVSYGHGKNTGEAEGNLQRHKADRERSGLRPGRGAEPPGVRKVEPRKEDPRAEERIAGGVREGATERVEADAPARAEEVTEVQVDDAAQRATEALAASLTRSGATDVRMRAVPHEFAEAGKKGAELRTARELAEKAFGKKIVYVDQDTPLFNGAYLPSAPDTLFLSTKTERPVLAVTGHELLHAMRRDRPDIYADLRDTLGAVMKDERGYFDELNAKREKRGMKPLDNDVLSEELIADIVGDRFTEPAFWDRMAQQDPTRFKQIAQNVLDWIKDAIAKLKGVKGPETQQYLKDLREAQRVVADALKKYSEGETPARDAQTTEPRLSVDENVRSMDAKREQREREFEKWQDGSGNVDDLWRQWSEGGRFRRGQPVVYNGRRAMVESISGSYYDLTDTETGRTHFGIHHGELKPFGKPKAVPSGEANLSISRRTPDPSKDRQALGEETATEVLTRKMFDRFNRVRKAQDVAAERGVKVDDDSNVVQADNLYYGRAQHEGELLEQKFINPLAEQLKEAKTLGLTVRDADDYAMALHAPERNAMIASRDPKIKAGSGLTDAQAKAIIDGFSPEQRKALDAIAKTLHEMTAAKLDKMLDAGLIDQGLHDTLKNQYKHYVPLKTLDDEDAARGLGRGYELRGAETQMAFGRGSKAGSPIAATIQDFSRTIIRAEKARVGKALWELAKDGRMHDIVEPINELAAPNMFARKVYNKDTKQIETKGDSDWKRREDVMQLKIDGKDEYVWVKDSLLREQIQKLAAQSDPGPVLRAVGKATGSIGRLLTEFNPAFTLPNAVRDALGTYLKSRAYDGVSPTKVVAGIPSAWKAIIDFKRDKTTAGADLYREFQEQGGKTGAYGIQDVANTMEHLARRGAELGYDDRKRGAGKKALATLAKAARVFSHANEVIEYATRLSLYKEARDAGYSKAKAAGMAKEITVNFNRSGEYGRHLNSVLVFANAGLQGLYGSLSYAKSYKVRRAMLALVAMGAANQAFNELVGGSDPDTGELNVNGVSDKVLDSNATILVPGKGDGVKIPLPPDYAWLFQIGRRAYRAISQQTYGKDAAGIGGALLGATLPLRAPDASSAPLASLRAVTPTVLSPFVDIAVNEDFFGRPVVPEQRNKTAPQPYTQLSRATTSQLAKDFADVLNTASGGDKVEPGAVQRTLGPFASPEAIEHLVEFFGGGLGQFVMQTKNAAKAAAGDEGALEVNKVPIVNRFVFSENQGYVARRYKELASAFEYAENRRKQNLDFDKVDPAVRDTLNQYLSTERTLRAMFKELREAQQRDDQPAAKEIKDRIKAAQTEVIRAYAEANKAR